MPKPANTRYRTTNWSDYNAALKRRGSLAIWFDPAMPWKAGRSGKRGHPETFSDSAIQTCLTLKVLFGLPLRQTVGLVASLIEMAGLDWPVPDYSTLCRRQARIQVQIPYRRLGQPLNLLIDSTGIRFRGDGEWLSRKHGATRRREWRKVHLAMDTATGDIRAVEFTSSRQGDSRSFRSCWRRSRRAKKSTLSPPTAPMTRAAAMPRSSSMEPTRSYRSAAMDAPGNPIVPPRYLETRSCKRHNVWVGPSGRNGPAITPEVVSKPK